MRFRPGSFDGAVSISALQWLCNVDAPSKMLVLFVSAADGSLACRFQGQKGARALQAPPTLFRAALQFSRMHWLFLMLDSSCSLRPMSNLSLRPC